MARPKTHHPSDRIVIQGAREHNLCDVSLDLPRDQLVVFTGLSGSGKSSLAFDTIYAEGQRRYVESLSSYARQFLGQVDKPDVDVIEGLSPAISIDQKSASRNPRSTVGTVTEIYDFLRLLYARAGTPHDPETGEALVRQTPQQIVDRILQLDEGTRFQVIAPIVRGRKGTYEQVFTDLAGQGFGRVRVDGEIYDLPVQLELARYEQHTIEVIVDRLVLREGIDRRLTDSMETALRLAEGVAQIELMPAKDAPEGTESELLTFSEKLARPSDGKSFEELAPRNFSFNTPYGACPACDGLGTIFEVDPELVVPDDELSVSEGALAPWASGHAKYFHRLLESVCEEFGIDDSVPFAKLSKKDRKLLLFGIGDTERIPVKFKNRYGRTRNYSAKYEGVIPYLKRRHAEAESDSARDAIEGYMRLVPCRDLRRRTSQPVGARSHHRRPQHLRAVQPVDLRGDRAAPRPRARRPPGRHRRVDPQGDQRPSALPVRRRTRLPVAVTLRGHALGWRGAAHPPGVADRLAGSSACCTCSTSRRSVCTSETTTG